MEKSGFATLLALADSYIADACPALSPELLFELRRIIRNYISGVITCTQASQLFIQTVGINTPVHRVSAILRVSELPLASCPAPVLPPRKKTTAWTQSEDERLLAAITRFGLDNWHMVSHFVGGHRTRSQCAQRWLRSLDPNISRVLWSHKEECRLSELVQQYGVHAWTRIAAGLGNRSDAQCRYHFLRIMKGKPVNDEISDAVRTDDSGTEPHASPPAEQHKMRPGKFLLPPIRLLMGIPL
jgi:hypothetical protein